MPVATNGVEEAGIRTQIAARVAGISKCGIETGLSKAHILIMTILVMFWIDET